MKTFRANGEANLDALPVPAGALFRLNEQWALLVAVDDRAVRRTVEVRRRNGRSAQITRPDGSMEDGVAVKKR